MTCVHSSVASENSSVSFISPLQIWTEYFLLDCGAFLHVISRTSVRHQSPQNNPPRQIRRSWILLSRCVLVLRRDPPLLSPVTPFQDVSGRPAGSQILFLFSWNVLSVAKKINLTGKLFFDNFVQFFRDSLYLKSCVQKDSIARDKYLQEGRNLCLSLFLFLFSMGLDPLFSFPLDVLLLCL